MSSPGTRRILGRHPLASVAVALAISSLLGCSLAARPEPNAPRNVRCVLAYRPHTPSAPAEQAGASATAPAWDLLFLAAARPYDDEDYYMSLPDVLLHGAAAPGRHLSKRLEIEGAVCEQAPWAEGDRLPTSFRIGRGLVCRRSGSDPVAFEVTTRWGTCRQEIPADDMQPRCYFNWSTRVDTRVRKRGLTSNVCVGQPAAVWDPSTWAQPAEQITEPSGS